MKLKIDLSRLEFIENAPQLTTSYFVMRLSLKYNSRKFSFTENLTIKALDFSVKLTIYAEESRRYLCFNKKWKLVGSVSVNVFH
jgi:hypothetical protein